MGCNGSLIDQKAITPSRDPILGPRVFPQPSAQSTDQNLRTPNQQSPSRLGYDLLNRSMSSINEKQFLNSYDYLEHLYELCQGNMDKFFDQLQQKISQNYMQISKETLQQMNQDILVNNQSKIQISQEILWFNLNILKVLSRKSQHKFNPNIFKQINKLQKNLVGYLKMKYPRGGQSFVPGDLMSVFKQFDLSEDIQFDLLKNSNTYFGATDDQTLSKNIKQFLNKLMNELDLVYPKFQKLMQQQVFMIKQENGQKRSLNYKIGRKIPQNVTKYTDMETNTLQINSPQVFRVIIKWMMYLEQILLEPNVFINTKKNFKSFVQENQNGQIVFDQVNEDQYYKMINQDLIQKIEMQKPSYKESNEALIKDGDVFNSHLLKVLDTSIRKQKYVPLKQMEIIKYSNLNTKFIAWILSQKLMLALKKLIQVGKSFQNTSAMINLDLIQFRVADLMRAMVIGNKKQILLVYNNMKTLEKQGQIKIIRIKNRLGTSLNDVMVIYTMANTFLICQVQLILADGSQKINKKHKNIETLNHFFYELQRSPFGILSQLAVLLAYKDSKVSYQNNITFQINQINIQSCQQSHPQSVTVLKEQIKPFICSKCTKFYFKYQNLFMMKICSLCNIFLCGQCIFQKNKDLLQKIKMGQIDLNIQKCISKTLSKLRNIVFTNTTASVLKIFETPHQKLITLFKQKSVSLTKFTQYLTNKAKNARQNLYFVLLHFRSVGVTLKCLKFIPASQEIINPFDRKQNFREKQRIYYSKYDQILFFDKNMCKQQTVTNLEDSMLYLFQNEKSVAKMFNSSKYLQAVQASVFITGDLKIVVDIQKINMFQRKNSFVSNSNKPNNKQKKRIQFKHQSLHEVTSNIPDLEGAKSMLKLSQLGIQTQHLQFFKQINWANNIKQLKLNRNNLENISIVLQTCLQLQRLYANQNQIKQLIFIKQLKNIEIINCSSNEIKKIGGIQRIVNISKLLLQNNKIQQFPVSNLPNLKILNLNSNPIKKTSFLTMSTFTNIQQLSIELFQDDQYSYDYQNNKCLIQDLILPFNKLKLFQSSINCQNLILDSHRIQRLKLGNNFIQTITIPSYQCLKYFDLSNNQIRDLQFLFSPKSHCENNIIISINAQNNYIQKFPLAKSTSLKQFNISGNKLVQINNLIESELLVLQNINFSKNKINKIPKLSFPCVKKLDFSENLMQEANQFKQSDLPLLQTLSLNMCRQMKQFPQFSFPNLKTIQMTSSILQKTQNLSNSKLPNLQSLVLTSCVMPQFPIIKIKSLKSLNLMSCVIQNIRNLQYCQLPNLQQLELDYLEFEFSLVEEQNHQEINNLQAVKKVQDKPQKSKRFSWKLNFPKLKNLSFSQTHVKNGKDFPISNLPELQTLNFKYTIFDKCPQINFKKLKIIQAEGCQIKSINDFVGKQLINLQELYLSFNKIQKIHTSFPEKLRIINLDSNQITQIQFLSQFKQLTRLQISQNKIKKFPSIKAKKLTQLFTDYNQIQDISQLSNCLFPKLQSLNIQSQNLKQCQFPIIKFQSIKSLYFKCNNLQKISNLSKCQLPLVQDINFSQNNNIQKIPRLNFPKLKYLRFNNNKITDLSQLELSQLPELEIIELQTNKIHTIPYLPFPKLKKIFMHQNQCTNVQGFNKSPIKELQVLNICQSPNLKQFPITKGNFNELYANQTMLSDVLRLNEYKELKIIQLNGNSITALPKLNHRGLTQIQFQDNQLTSIDQFCEDQYNLCTQFSVKGNQIKKAPLLKMQKLKRMYFNDNPIQDASQFCNSDLPELQMVSFQNGNLKSLTKLPFPTLKEIYLTNNQSLKQLKCFNLESYEQLVMIVAHATGIQQVQILPKMQKLQKIWVSNSKVKSLDWLQKSIKNLPKLSFFNGANNKISKLPSLKGNALNSIYMNGNPIENFDRFIADGQQQLQKYYTCQLSIKSETDDKYLEMTQKITKAVGEKVYYTFTKYYD